MEGIPVLIDSNPATWTLDPDFLLEEIEIRRKRRGLPKAAISTDIYGQCADLDRIMHICLPYGIPVVADAAEDLGATYDGAFAGN